MSHRVSDKFKANVKKWVTYDDKLEKANEAISKVKEKQQDIGNKIFKYMKKRNAEKKKVKIGDSQLKCTTRKKTTPLTKKFVKNCLTECLQNARAAEEVSSILCNTKKRIEAVLTHVFQDETKAEEAAEILCDPRRRMETALTHIIDDKRRADAVTEFIYGKRITTVTTKLTRKRKEDSMAIILHPDHAYEESEYEDDYDDYDE